MYIYIIIILITVLLAFTAQKQHETEHGKTYYCFKPSRFILSFFVAWFFIAFTKSGVDYNNYFNIAKVLNWNTIASYPTLEVGFNVVLVFLKSIFHNCHVVLFFVKTITIFLFFVGAYHLKNVVRVGYTIASYMFLVYIPSMYLLSISLAAALVFCAMVVWHNSKRVFWPLFLVMIATSIHSSVYLFLPVFVACIIIEKHPRISKLYLFLIGIGYVAIIAFASMIFSFSEKTFSFFHYSNYNVTNSGGLGIFNYILYLPLVYFSIITFKEDKDKRNTMMVLILSIFLFRLLSYRFVVIERMEYLLVSYYMIYLSEVLTQDERFQVSSIRRMPIWTCFLILYMVARLVLVLTEFVTADTGLLNYALFNPFIG